MVEISALRVTIVVCTTGRTEYITRLIPHLWNEIESVRPLRVDILVVDNRISGYQDRVHLYLSLGAISILESRKGVGFARNAALDFCADGRWLIFFDDDQIPDSRWLAELVAPIFEEEEVIGVGPVLPHLPGSVLPRWGAGWAWGGNRNVFAEGESRRYAGFGNVIIPPKLVNSLRFRVDDRRLIFSGEDTLLSVRARQLGVSIVHLRGAGAKEHVTRERLTFRWVLCREYREGAIWAYVANRFEGVTRRSILKSACGSLLLACIRSFIDVHVGLPARLARLSASGAATLGKLAGVARSFITDR